MFVFLVSLLFAWYGSGQAEQNKTHTLLSNQTLNQTDAAVFTVPTSETPGTDAPLTVPTSETPGTDAPLTVPTSETPGTDAPLTVPTSETPDGENKTRNFHLKDVTLNQTGPDVTISNASDVTTSNASDVTISNASDVTISNASDVTTSNASDVTTSNASDVTISNASDVTTSNASDVTISNASDVTTSNASDVTISNASDVTTSNASDVTTSNASDVTTSNASDVTISNASDVTTSNASDVTTSNASDVTTSGGGDATSVEADGVEADGVEADDPAGQRVFLPEKQIEERIIGGQEAWAHSWPWQVSLRYGAISACGGAVLTPSWVITAAHCFLRYNKVSRWTVLAGKHNLDDENEEGQQVTKVSGIFSHQKYDTKTKQNDVALVKVKTQFTWTSFVRPIGILMGQMKPLKTCTVTGWGCTMENGIGSPRLQEVNVTYLPSDMCNQFYWGNISPSMFCAGDVDGGVDACQGDSGGPLSCLTEGRYELAGVVSWGVGCGRAKRPGVYTKLQSYKDWIDSIMNNTSLIESSNPLEETCGEAETLPCLPRAALARVTVSLEGEVQVGNVSEACPHSWPWQVSLQLGGMHYCSGTLIHPLWVLAPQHCNPRADFDSVVLGAHDLTFLDAQTISIDKVFSSPRSGGFPPPTDLSLIRLSQPAPIGATISLACLPPDNVVLDDSWSCVTTGWGTTSATVDVSSDTLHQARLMLVNNTACNQSWGRNMIKSSHLCTNSAASFSCMGDAGAPLFCRKHGLYFLFGLMSWGSRQCDQKPAVFSKMSAYNSWINNVLGI